jgi:hypothetical protein
MFFVDELQMDIVSGVLPTHCNEIIHADNIFCLLAHY